MLTVASPAFGSLQSSGLNSEVFSDNDDPCATFETQKLFEALHKHPSDSSLVHNLSPPKTKMEDGKARGSESSKKSQYTAWNIYKLNEA